MRNQGCKGAPLAGEDVLFVSRAVAVAGVEHAAGMVNVRHHWFCRFGFTYLKLEVFVSPLYVLPSTAVGLVEFDTEESSNQPPERFDESFPDTEISLMTAGLCCLAF